MFVCCRVKSNLNHWPVSALDDESEGGKRMIELGWGAQTYPSAPNLKVLKDLLIYCFQTLAWIEMFNPYWFEMLCLSNNLYKSKRVQKNLKDSSICKMIWTSL